MIFHFFQRALVWRRCVAKVDVHFAVIWLQLLACLQLTGINCFVVTVGQPHVHIAKDLLQGCVLCLPLHDEHLGTLHMFIVSVPRIIVASLMLLACVNQLSPPNAETTLEVTLLLVALLLLSEMGFLCCFTIFLLAFGRLSLSTPIATHLLNVFHHLIVTGALGLLRTAFSRLLQPRRKMIACRFHLLEEIHFVIPALRMSRPPPSHRHR